MKYDSKRDLIKFNTIGEKLIEESIHLLVDVFFPRLQKCINFLSEEDIWIKPNKTTPSVGNLVLHLSGNIKQWIISALGGELDTRKRVNEFNEKSQPSKAKLLEQLSRTISQSKFVLRKFNSDELLKVYQVQAYEKTGMSIILHVVEHFSYHVGQITYIVKSKKGVDTAYYSGVNLNQTK